MLNEIAVREAVINAIVHNNDTRETPPKFEFFAGRLEMTLPDKSKSPNQKYRSTTKNV